MGILNHMDPFLGMGSVSPPFSLSLCPVDLFPIVQLLLNANLYNDILYHFVYSDISCDFPLCETHSDSACKGSRKLGAPLFSTWQIGALALLAFHFRLASAFSLLPCSASPNDDSRSQRPILLTNAQARTLSPSNISYSQATTMARIPGPPLSYTPRRTTTAYSSSPV